MIAEGVPGSLVGEPGPGIFFWWPWSRPLAKGVGMATSEEVRVTALSLAQAGASADDAVPQLLDCCGGRRVSVVMARQLLQEEAVRNPDDDVYGRAVEYLDALLAGTDWA
jgi:hypothetical protein